MHRSRSVLLILLGMGFAFEVGATPTPTQCTSTCTPGAVQCDSSGNIETCTEQGSAGASGCPASAELVYVVDENNTFSSFTPGSTPTFTDIGTLNCPDLLGGTPFSMSVDRSGTAWVLYSDGTIFNVDTTTLACTASSYDALTTGWSNFGMGFVAQTAGGTTDNLFIANVQPLQLGLLNTSSMSVSTLGTLTGSPELTGTGSAQLWGFFPDANNPRVSELDQTTGAEGTSWPMTALAGSPEAWAFAFYGGDFWVFLERTSDTSTNVWHLDGTTGAVTEALTNTGRNIVGAGESTCVPSSTCYTWTTTPCSANQTCSNGQCVASCAGSCTVGATQCGADGMPQVCGFGQEISTPCPEWLDQACSTACGGGGVCLTACTEGAEINTCPAGDTCQSTAGAWYCLPAPSTTTSASGSTSGTTSGPGTGASGASGTAGTNSGASGNANSASGAGASGTSRGSGASGNASGAAGGASGNGNGNGNGAAGSNGTGGSSGSTGPSENGALTASGGCGASGPGLPSTFSLLALATLLGQARRKRP